MCADVDECAKDNGGCTEHSTCKNTPGSYDCVCDTGYKAHGPKCVGQLTKPNFIYVLSRDVTHMQIRLIKLLSPQNHVMINIFT